LSSDGTSLGGISHLVLVFGFESTRDRFIPHGNIPSTSEATSFLNFNGLLVPPGIWGSGRSAGDMREEKRMTGEVCAPPCAVPAISAPGPAERDRTANFACVGNKDGKRRVKGRK
jgi:hypothetical protein